MDFAYSPHREVGGTLHLHSPTHPHSYRVDGFPSIKQIRRSLSRSPSKASRFTLHTSPQNSPKSPLSPLALSRAFSPKSATSKENNAPNLFPFSPLEATPTTTTKKSKSGSRPRLAPFRSSPRVRAGARSPVRRALSDSLNQANKSPSSSGRGSNDDSDTEEDPEPMESDSDMKPAVARLDFNDGPIKFEFAKPKTEGPLHPPKSSPLKRSDGIMNLDQASLGSPTAKRRSLHGGPFSTDFDIFDHPPGQGEERGNNDQDKDMSNYSFSTPLGPRRASPIRKLSSLRRSTLQQRYGSGATARPRLLLDQGHEFLMPGNAASRSKSRMSLDSAITDQANVIESPFRRGTPLGVSRSFPPNKRSMSGPTTGHHPHPLSNALTPSSSNSSMSDVGDSPKQPTPAAPAPKRQTIAEFARPPISFSRSLPIGASRPGGRFNARAADPSDPSSFATPDSFKGARPHQAPFLSTGLMSKKNRNIDVPPPGGENYAMPDTPSKRISFPPLPSSTPFQRSTFGKSTGAQHEFGTPSTPFLSNAAKATPVSFGQGVSIFGSRMNALPRRGSFISIDGDDHLQSPCALIDSQSSLDEFPPTPTKQGSSGRNSRDNSLRSNLFGRRASIAPDTFVPPTPGDITSPSFPKSKSFPTGSLDFGTADEDESPTFASRTFPPCRSPSFGHSRVFRRGPNKASPLFTERSPKLALSTPSPAPVTKKPSLSSAIHTPTVGQSPQTPQSGFTPDTGRLSISAQVNRRGSLQFNSSSGSAGSFPPATPTATRDQLFNFSTGAGVGPITGLTKNDVDTSLTNRFESVKVLPGDGEFSQVFLVGQPIGNNTAQSESAQSLTKGWVVKKSKKPLTGPRDMERKKREVKILKTLRGHEHIIEFVDNWVEENHLYIQTEYCENGNLKTFLSETGDKARLDDFRIWKILLELSLGVKYIHDSGFIHLDLKPANVFIDWEGVLKIGDFGLASTWPAPAGIEGEGDREYIGPEILNGKFDKPADIFALGMIMVEIAGNIILPDNGVSWQRLRSGDMTDVPSLTWSSESTLERDEVGDPITDDHHHVLSHETLLGSDHEDETSQALRKLSPRRHRSEALVDPPKFMADPDDEGALDKVVQWMIYPEPEQRPTIEQVHYLEGVQWVERRRRAGATIYEGNWGPAEEVLNHDVDMADAD